MFFNVQVTVACAGVAITIEAKPSKQRLAIARRLLNVRFILFDSVVVIERVYPSVNPNGRQQ